MCTVPTVLLCIIPNTLFIEVVFLSSVVLFYLSSAPSVLCCWFVFVHVCCWYSCPPSARVFPLVLDLFLIVLCSSILTLTLVFFVVSWDIGTVWLCFLISNSKDWLQRSFQNEEIFGRPQGLFLYCVIYTHAENEFTLFTLCGLCNDYLLSPDPKLDSDFMTEHFKSKMKFDDEYVTAARCVLMWKSVRFWSLIYSFLRELHKDSSDWWSIAGWRCVTEGRLASLVYLLLNNMRSSDAVHCSLVFLFYQQ